ncbi:hypothetical protein [Erwinia sp. HR93]|uniref:hypothetical protein n=1 Tax=Erwinia sp. HR93 TaxID=3094840 RepID=UPI002ADEEE04|nr:hypothetical protein [Erwinia sp. HR93]MEA1062268.1 hypothetical protein [Erwinia sp. HR93]MEA1063925.1 hypothetical protein [Erwinia sp. HR93]
MDDQTPELDSLLRDIWQQQGCAYSTPQRAPFDSPRACAGCGRPIAPSVLTVQPMATHCHYCRSGG